MHVVKNNSILTAILLAVGGVIEKALQFKRRITMESSAVVTVLQNTYKWQSSSVTCYRGPLDHVRRHIPTFERKTFGPALLPAAEYTTDDNEVDLITQPLPAGFNRFYDVIVRNPLKTGDVEVPVGIVSRQYTLIQHQDLIDTALAAVTNAGIKPADIKAELDLTEYGERMRLGLLFPEKYNRVLPNHD